LAGMGLGFAREKPYTATGATASASFLLAVATTSLSLAKISH